VVYAPDSAFSGCPLYRKKSGDVKRLCKIKQSRRSTEMLNQGHPVDSIFKRWRRWQKVVCPSLKLLNDLFLSPVNMIEDRPG